MISKENIKLFSVVAGVVAAIVYFKNRGSNEAISPQTSGIHQQEVVDSAPTNQKDTSRSENNSDSGLANAQVETVVQAPMPVINSHIDYMQKKIANKLKLNVALPPEYSYRDIEFDDIEVASGVYGYDQATKTHLVIAGVKKQVDPKDILQFLSESGDELPGFDKSLLRGMKAPKRGVSHGQFNEPYVWEVETATKSMTVALVTRKDGLGSYVAILNGPGDSLSNQEERFEDIYDSMAVAK